MSMQGCPKHADLVALIRDGSADKDILAHVEACEECGEVARVVRGLAPLAMPSREVPPVSDVYWQARAQEILDAQNRTVWRAIRPLRFLNIGVGATLVVAALVLATGPLTGLFGVDALVVTGPLSALMAAVGARMALSGTGNLQGRTM